MYCIWIPIHKYAQTLLTLLSFCSLSEGFLLFHFIQLKEILSNPS